MSKQVEREDDIDNMNWSKSSYMGPGINIALRWSKGEKP